MQPLEKGWFSQLNWFGARSPITIRSFGRSQSGVLEVFRAWLALDEAGLVRWLVLLVVLIIFLMRIFLDLGMLLAHNLYRRMFLKRNPLKALAPPMHLLVAIVLRNFVVRNITYFFILPSSTTEKWCPVFVPPLWDLREHFRQMYQRRIIKNVWLSFFHHQGTGFILVLLLKFHIRKGCPTSGTQLFSHLSAKEIWLSMIIEFEVLGKQ